GPPRSRFSPLVQPSRQAVPGSRRYEGFELPHAPVDGSAIRALDPVHAEVLDRERRAYRPVEDSPAERRVVERPGAGQMAKHPAREGVPGTGRVADLIERVGRRPKDPVLRQEKRAVLGTFDDD